MNGNPAFQAESYGSNESSATPKQLGLLRHLGVEIPEDCTKQRASELIDEAKA